MAFQGAFLFALLSLIVGVGLFKGNIATQVGDLYAENDLRRAMAFQIFYIFINVSVIVAPLISGTLGQDVGWHYGFGCAGVVMVLGLIIYLSGHRRFRPTSGPADARPRPIDRPGHRGGARDRRFGSRLAADLGRPVFVLGHRAAFPPWSWSARSTSFLTRNLDRIDRQRTLALVILIPVMAISLLTNQEIFNAYLVWGDQQFNLHFLGHDLSQQLADHNRCRRQLRDAGRGRGLLELVEPQAPRSPTRSAR